jgi:uncharacterized protein YqgC (DUF456 family)
MFYIGSSLSRCFVIAFIGLVYPIIPSVVFIVAGFVLYGFLFTFGHYSYLFWIIEGIFTAVLFAADYIANLLGIKRFGVQQGGDMGQHNRPFDRPFCDTCGGHYFGAVCRGLGG